MGDLGPKSGRKAVAIRLAKAAVAVAVLAAVGRHVARTWHDLHARGVTLKVDAGALAVGVVLYIAGLAAFGVYFGRVLAAGPTPVGMAQSVRSYLISHLGKYVPGKAMVVLMRVGLLAPIGARPATVAFASLYETLAMMAAGGFVAAAGFGLASAARAEAAWPALAGLGLGAGFLVLVSPAIFARLSGLVRVPFPGVGPDALPRLTGRLLAEGIAWAVLGWVLLGLSQVAVAGAVASRGIDPARWPQVIAATALATVAGFAVAVLPGGLGVREGVLMVTLAPEIGDEAATVAALALRLAWVGAEAAVAGILYPLGPIFSRRAMAAQATAG